ncbi:pentatricopeptide repeat-containing protein At5g08510-like [Miscanthus floridulus]|uniref:pentatricopeptide repeat-containing protein At5g08510-like n=1 Tax=Miscanthus floridulus TaxID=154761 RepID=UPI003458BD1A
MGRLTSIHTFIPLEKVHIISFNFRERPLPSLPLVASIHAAVLRRGVPALLAASLIQGYSACGDLVSARALFDETPPTLSSRTALAGALSAHGQCAEALALLAVPEAEADDRAVTVLLAACARAGMVAEGRRVFVRVPRPALQHYTCMVEMLGRAGEVEEAERLVAGVEARPDRVIFAALLAACRVHGRVDVAERVAGLMRRYGIA